MDSTDDDNNNAASYSDDFKEMVLEASLSNSLLETCFRFNVSPSVVSEWQREEGIHAVVSPTNDYQSSKYSTEFIHEVLFYLKVNCKYYEIVANVVFSGSFHLRGFQGLPYSSLHHTYLEQEDRSSHS